MKSVRNLEGKKEEKKLEERKKEICGGWLELGVHVILKKKLMSIIYKGKLKSTK